MILPQQTLCVGRGTDSKYSMTRLLLLSVLCFTSCQLNDKSAAQPEPKNTSKASSSKSNPEIDNALAFINAYVDAVNKQKMEVDVVAWVNNSELATKHFKLELKNLMDAAHQQDSIVGLDADPIFDAQYFPEKGFELDSFYKTNYLSLKGKDIPDFKITIKMVQENGRWLVDGCGMVNIPDDKKARLSRVNILNDKKVK